MLLPIARCSRTLTEAERKYSQTGKEPLASVWSCEKFSKYFIGLPSFELMTDHRSLVKVLTTKDLIKVPSDVSNCWWKWCDWIQECHEPGKNSRWCLLKKSSAHREDETNVNRFDEYIESIETRRVSTEIILNDIKVATARGVTLQVLRLSLITGLPKMWWLLKCQHSNKIHQICRLYWE